MRDKNMSWELLLLASLCTVVVVIHRCSGFSQGSAIVNAFESSYCESGLDDLQRGPLHYDMVACAGVCRAEIAPRNLYALRANATEYSANNNVTLTLHANSRLGANILGFVIVAIAESGMTAGRWMVDADDDDPEVLRATCDSLLEGQVIFHAKPSTTRTAVEVLWNPRSTNYGRIIFRAWVVQRHDTIYTVDSEPLTNPLDGARYISSMERHLAFVLGDIVMRKNNNNTEANTSDLRQQQQHIDNNDDDQRDIRASTSRRARPNTNANTSRDNKTRDNTSTNDNVSSSLVRITPASTPPPPLPPQPSTNTLPSFIPQRQPTSPTTGLSLDNPAAETQAQGQNTRKRLPSNIMRSVRNRISTTRQKLAIPSNIFRSNRTASSSDTFNLEDLDGRENPTIPLLSISSDSSPKQNRGQSINTDPSQQRRAIQNDDITHTLQNDDDRKTLLNDDVTRTLQNDDVTQTLQINDVTSVPSPISRDTHPERDVSDTPLLHLQFSSSSSPTTSLLERFENSFQSRMTSGYNLTRDDPFSHFNAHTYSLGDFFPAESLPQLLNVISQRNSNSNIDSKSHNRNGNPLGGDHGNIDQNATPQLQSQSNQNEASNTSRQSQSNQNEAPNNSRQLQSPPNENESISNRPTIKRVITPAGNPEPQVLPAIQPPSNANPPQRGAGSDRTNHQFLQQPDFQSQLQWQQQQQQHQQQQNQNNFNQYPFPWMNPMRNYQTQTFPSFQSQNPSSFPQTQPQPNQWLVNDNQPFFTFSPNRENMATHSNNFVGRFPNADQLLGRTFPNANNNFRTMPNINNDNNINNNNNFLPRGVSNQPFNNVNNNGAGNTALQNQVRMFLANRNQAMRGSSSGDFMPMMTSQQGRFPQRQSLPPATNGNGNADGISFNWFG